MKNLFMKVYSGLDELPSGRADDALTEGCLVLEGGAWRGIYTQGVLDALMEEGINLKTTIGISAGAMSGLGYVSGQVGWCARINLSHRQDPEYCGFGALMKDHGVTGFTYLFKTLMKESGFDLDRFMDPERRFLVVATNCETGRPVVFQKGHCDIFRAVQASATVPYVSRPVVIRGVPFLDGSCSVSIPYDWAVRKEYKKIVVVRTRERAFRKEEKDEHRMNALVYPHFPELQKALNRSAGEYNILLDRLDADEAAGKAFVLAPSRPVTIRRFERDVEALGRLYHLGYDDAKEAMDSLKVYLAM